MSIQPWRVLVGACAILSVTLSASSLAAQEVTIYKADTVYTMTGEPISPGEVAVSDGKIVAVGKSVEGNESAVVVELGEGSVLMPGLVDAYSQNGLEARSANEITDEVTPNYAAVRALDWSRKPLKRQLLAGTTTMNVCPGTGNVVSGMAAVIKTDPQQQAVVQERGALLVSLCNDPASGNRSRARPDSIFVRQPTNRMGVVWILRNTMFKAQQNPSDEQYHPLHEVFAGERPLMVVSRMSFDLDTVGTLADEFGYSPIIVGGQEAYKIKDLLAERNYPVVLQPFATGAVRGEERSELCWNQAGVLAEAGLTVALSGDDLLEQARFAHRFGLEKQQALAAITSTPAKILGLEKQVGAIAVGHDADLIALNGDPLELTTSIRWVIVNGKPIEITKDK